MIKQLFFGITVLLLVASVQAIELNGDVLQFQFKNWASVAESRTNVFDFSRSNNNGTVSGASFNRAGGRDADGAFEFDGSNDKISVRDNNALSPSTRNALTISTWVRFDKTEFVGEGSQKDYINFLGKGQSGSHEYTFRYYNSSSRNNANKISFSLYNLDGGYGTTVSVQEPINRGEWVHLVATYDGANVKLFKNGILKDSISARNVGVVPGNGRAPL